MMKSSSKRRPKPPPRKVVWTSILSSGMPVSLEPMPRRRPAAHLVLGGRPDRDAVGPHVGGGVHRLHAGMRQIGHLVDRLQLLRAARQRSGGVAILAGAHPGPIGQGDELGPDGLATGLGQRALVPHHLERVPSLLGIPVAVGHDGDAGPDLDHVLHPG